MRLLLLVMAAAALLATAQEPGPAPDAKQLALRAAHWTARFEKNLSGLLFREDYIQRLAKMNAPAAAARQATLEANVFLLNLPGSRETLLYRDVYALNGKPLGDHTERLQKLLASPSRRSMEQARRLSDASARHNLGSVTRNINLPTMVFAYLWPRSIGKLEFTIEGTETLAGLDTTIVGFKEVRGPTLVRTDRFLDIPAQGRFWIHAPSGTIARGYVSFPEAHVVGHMQVDLQLVEALGVWAPREMTESWTYRNEHITGVATYSNFKKMHVSTAEAVK
ncbi:MAG: hypothetical protein M3R55_10075 [Acidobacteriota bacterium]|nr:hypothetical protein [Acidobacteriota bacterium]